MSQTQDIVARLWNLCHILRDDGITYHQYVTELTYLLFLKMLKETGNEGQLPETWRWGDLERLDGVKQLEFYREMLAHLGNEGQGRVKEIFANASTTLRQARNLNKLVRDIDDLDWYDARTEGLGDLYEGLLQRNAEEKKSGAGQYFTPRPLIDCMVALVKPRAGELVQDPALGTGGFLIAADRHIKAQTDDLFNLPERQQVFQRREAFYGMELVQDTHRLALMNAMLHGIEGDVRLGDTLSSDGAALRKADVILTNPPFGTKKGGGLPTRDDFTYRTSNKQLNFLQHVYRALKPGGRAAVVLPDNVLFEEGIGVDVRRDLMNKCDLHTLLRLPTGIFYAQGVKTNVLFFTRGKSDKGNTQGVWVYDLRANMPSFGKRTPLTREQFASFEAAYGDDPYGKAAREDQGESGRFRIFSRDAIASRGDNLDIAWRDENTSSADGLPDPEEIAARVIERLRTAMAEMERLNDDLSAAAFRGDLTADWRESHPVAESASLLLNRIRLERRRRWEAAELARMKSPPRDDRWKARYQEPEPIDERDLPELPEGWCWTTIEAILAEPLCNGISVKGSDHPPGVPSLKLNAMSEQGFNYSAIRYIPIGETTAEDLAVKEGDFFISRGNGSLALVGRGTLAQRPTTRVVFPDTMIRMRFVDGANAAHWVSCLWSSDWVRRQIESRVKTTAGIWKISQTDVASIVLPIPPLAEQQFIIARISHANRTRNSVLAKVSDLIGDLRLIDQSIFSKAFRGELVPQDPDDEPASALLERIRAERSSPNGPSTKRSRQQRLGGLD